MDHFLQITLLGACCSGNCSILEHNLLLALAELGLEYKLERVDDLSSIISYGCLESPGLVIDGKLISQGTVLSQEQLKKYLLSLDISKRDSF